MGAGPSILARRLPPWALERPLPRLHLGDAGHWLAESWRADGHRRILWLPVGLCGGIALYFALPREPAAWCADAAFAAFLVLAVGAARSGGRPLARAGMALVAVFALGFADAQWRTQALAAPVLHRRANAVRLSGRIESIEPHAGRLRLVIGALAPIRRFGPQGTPAKVRISTRAYDSNLRPGDWVRVTATLLPPPDPAAPGGYDFARAAYFQRIGAVGYAYGYPYPTAPPRPDTTFEAVAAWVERLRDAITARIVDSVGGREGAICAALVTGKRGAIEEADNAAFRDAGLAHVLVIAGVHLSLAAGFFFWLVRALLAAIPPIALRYPIKKIAAAAAMLGAAILLVLSGCGQPAMRATIMLWVMFAAILADRPAFSMRSVALAATIILLLQPEGLVSAGFQLSFAAVIGLIARAEWGRRRDESEDGREDGREAPPTIFDRVRRHIGGIAMTSTVAGIATAPFSIFHFDRAAQYGILGNMLAMPIVATVVMPAATLAMVLMPFGLDRVPLLAMGKGVAATLYVAHLVSALPGAAAMVPAWPYAALSFTALGGLWWAIWQARWRWLGLAAIAAGLALGLSARQPDVLISRDGRDVAVRLADGRLAYLRPPADAFSAEPVFRRDGDSRDPGIAVGGPGLRCDWQGCTARLANGTLLAASSRASSLAADCAAADIVIAAEPVRRHCRGPKLLIDRFDVARNGATAITLGAVLRVDTVRAVRGDRPWSARPPARPRAGRRPQ